MATVVLLPGLADASFWWERANWRQVRECADFRPRIVVVGDSIAEDPSGWVSRVVEARPDLEIINTACGGCSLRDVLAHAPAFWPRRFGGIWRYRVEPWLPADLFVFAFGPNGATGFFEPASIEPAAWQALFQEVLDVAEGPAILIPPNTFFGYSGFDVNDTLLAYQDAVYRLASENRWVEVADPNGLLAAEDYPVIGYRTDIHPGPTGDAKIAEVVLDVLDGLFPERDVP